MSNAGDGSTDAVAVTPDTDTTSPRHWLPSTRSIAVAIPVLWLTLFFLIPLFVVFKISLSEPRIAQPPYAPMLQIAEDSKVSVTINTGNYAFLASDALYAAAYLESIWIAFVSTVLCLLIGYPMAYVISRAAPGVRSILLILVMLPFWTSFLLRVYAWIGLLKDNGTINNLLISLGLITQPLQIMYTDVAVYIGIVYAYLPFMVLPLYANLSKLEPELLEAAADLGATPLRGFLTVTLPLSVPGIVAGSLLVFIPAIGEYVIPALLGANDTLMIGRILWDEFFLNRDWPLASAVAIAILVVVVLPIMFLRQKASEAVR